jgi:Tfp pilus assembly protein PilN
MITKILQGLGRAQDVLCVAVHGRKLTAAVVSGKDYAVFKVWQQELPAAEELLEVLEQELTNLLAENKLPAVGKLVFVLDTDMVFLQRLELPPMPQAELREALKWEAQEYVPFTDGSYCMDFVAVQKDDNMQSVFLGAMPLEVLERLREISSRLKLDLLAVTALPLAQAAFLQQEQNNFLLAEDNQDSVSLTAFIDGMPVIVQQAAAEIASVEEEIAVLTETVRQKYNIQLRDIFYTDNGTVFTAWQEGVNEILNQQYCFAAVDFTGKFSWQGSFVTEAERRQCAAIAMSAAGGVLMADSGAKVINFAGGGKQTEKVKIYQYLAAALLFIMFAACGSVYGYSVYQANKIEHLQEQITAMDIWQQRYASVQKVEHDIHERDNTLNVLAKEQFDWGNFLELLGRTAPEGCWINKVQQNEQQDEILLYGRVENLSDLEAFIEGLRNSDSITSAELVETRDEQKKNLISYTVLLVKGGSKHE